MTETRTIRSEPPSGEPRKMGAGLERESRGVKTGGGVAVLLLFRESLVKSAAASGTPSPPAAVPTPDVCF